MCHRCEATETRIKRNGDKHLAIFIIDGIAIYEQYNFLATAIFFTSGLEQACEENQRTVKDDDPEVQQCKHEINALLTYIYP